MLNPHVSSHAVFLTSIIEKLQQINLKGDMQEFPDSQFIVIIDGTESTARGLEAHHFDYRATGDITSNQ